MGLAFTLLPIISGQLHVSAQAKKTQKIFNFSTRIPSLRAWAKWPYSCTKIIMLKIIKNINKENMASRFAREKPDTSCQLPKTRKFYWLLVTGYWLLVTGYWLLVLTNLAINTLASCLAQVSASNIAGRLGFLNVLCLDIIFSIISGISVKPIL